MTVRLRGMTWSHPRGYDPLVACAAVWAETTGVEISWDKRSLQDFESYPVAELARAYDLIVIDHPHIGQITEEGCLAPLDGPDWAAKAAQLQRQSVGQSFASYNWKGRQWALPIDAATQVLAFRPDELAAPPFDWPAVMDLARQGRVLVPLLPPHSLMLFMTLCAHLRAPCGQAGFVDPEIGRRVLGMMAELASHLPPACFGMDPIAALELLSSEQERFAVSPYLYGYASYSLDAFRPHRLRFAQIPVIEGTTPSGATLGGTGIAVSALSAHRQEAIRHAWWLASDEVQAGVYARSGGQPGNAAAWEDEAVNAASWDFYRGTRSTLENSYVRPRFSGYMGFQAAAAEALTDWLQKPRAPDDLLAELETLFAQAQSGNA